MEDSPLKFSFTYVRPDAHGYNNNSLKFVTENDADQDDKEKDAIQT